MVARLNVIMVHSPPPSASAQRLGESVVGQLIGLPGVDLTLIGPLAGLHELSTDRLTLESIEGDVVVLDWLTEAETLQSLHSIGFAGQRSPHPNDPVAASVSGGRRVYLFDLNRFDDAGQVCSALAGLKESRQVRTFSLGRPVDRSVRRRSVSSPLPAGEEQLSRSLKASPDPTDQPAKRPQPEPGRAINLDELVDELDRFDP